MFPSRVVEAKIITKFDSSTKYPAPKVYVFAVACFRTKIIDTERKIENGSPHGILKINYTMDPKSGSIDEIRQSGETLFLFPKNGSQDVRVGKAGNSPGKL